ncbi:glycerol 2-dehydrogenase (NADP+) [Geosmithia morbida]|uniref:Glycerol 2-dehydrogenase (NADP+) n=1 Tax=Geosmithia morbida TaxID=1094350 RepID=A0A9P4YQ02_9HYPO|nr:glycerol 2-dehydrogenase (NADP+) [Geosmithia morbida]KAF4119905.1 glycerol 2-dehydrogenase (NADP+) [Geosmithia morbida]
MADKTFKLNNGADIPAFGLGTWQGEPGKVRTAVSHALKNGYRLIDCAYCYGNEEEVGQGLVDAFTSGVKREDVFVMTKVWATYNSRVELGLDKSLKALGLDYVDLFLVHWPLLLNPEGNDDRFPKLPDGSRDIVHGWDHREAWKQMEALVATGKVRGIGVCNYSQKYLEELLPVAKVVPAINQIENHPALPQTEIVDTCKANGIHIVAYSPLGSTGSPLQTAEPVVKVAEKKGATPVQILLSYHVSRGQTVLAKSVNPDRIIANKDIIDLDTSDLNVLDDYSNDLARKKELKRYVYPPFGINFGFPDKQ